MSMKRHRRPGWASLAGTALAAVLLTMTALPAAAAVGRPAAGGSPAQARAAAGPRLCRSRKDPALARQLSRGIEAALRGRRSVVAVQVDDPYRGVKCWLNSRRHFYSASVVKATILAALLLKANTEHRALTSTEKQLAYQMITRSSIPAADALWIDVGMASLQTFLDRAGMTETVLGQGGWWGLTKITTHDETRFLWLLLNHNRVLTNADRRYELTLMSQVIPAQRWGVRAGAPKSFGWHIKNGWTPSTPYGWLINSIGGFTHRGGQDYTMVVLTHSNPSMRYGIVTIERVAVTVNHGLNPAAGPVWPLSAPSSAWGVPDEPIPPAGTGR